MVSKLRMLRWDCRTAVDLIFALIRPTVSQLVVHCSYFSRYIHRYQHSYSSTKHYHHHSQVSAFVEFRLYLHYAT